MSKLVPIQEFKIIIDNTPLLSIDFICKDQNDKILLGKRTKKPALGYYFTPGGRVFKNETIEDAIKRLSLKELGVEIEKKDLKFNGIYEHFYDDSIFDDISTHYINIAFEYEFEIFENLPKLEHEEYKMFSINQLMDFNEVHENVKDFFKTNKGIK